MQPAAELRKRRPPRREVGETHQPEPALSRPDPSCRLQHPDSEGAEPYRSCHKGARGHEKAQPNPKSFQYREASWPPPQLVCGPGRGRAPPDRGFRVGGRWARALILGAALLVFARPAAALSTKLDIVAPSETGVCTSMDIRNNPDNLKRLASCRVVEGFLQILLFDNFNETAYRNLTFPQLREITGYLLMYRVNGLPSLGKLFPNLAVIRGRSLFYNYAFVLYEMMHMQDIGLNSLTDISRGSVRIEKNYMLCFVNTIDWNLIAADGKDNNYIKENKPDNECPLCPGDAAEPPGSNGRSSLQDGVRNGSGNGNRSSGAQGALMQCPARMPHNPKARSKHLCWNKDHCQKVCPSECGENTCTDSGHCCDKSCLGGCLGRLLDNCTVCKNLSIGDLPHRRCINVCPPNTFVHQGRRCISAAECRTIPAPKELKIKKPKFHKPINGTCMLDCPQGFSEVPGVAGACEPCKGVCVRECGGANVDSIEAAAKLHGCTYINGSIEISVRAGGNIVKELENGLGLITDIQGSLKIMRSFPLVSLNFFKSLQTIHGIDNESGKYVQNALSVTDNQNLQDLWDWDVHEPIKILRGKLFFHFNPKLCYEKIMALKDMTADNNFTELEVATNSNGDKVACNVTELNVTVVWRVQNSVLIGWNAFKHDDTRSLLGYVVYSIEAPYKNVTLYEGRDACGGDGWHVDDIQVTSDSFVNHVMTHLKPYTQYAVYVKTYTIATEKRGAQSKLLYVQTLPGQPSPPRIMGVLPQSPSSLLLQWEPPAQPNGNVTQYKVAVIWEEDKEEFLMQRNYCNEPLVYDDKKPEVIVEEKPKEVEVDNSKCNCNNNAFPTEEEALQQISFEDYLQNQAFQKRVVVEETRRRRDINEFPYSDINKSAAAQPPQQELKSIRDPITDLYDVYFEAVDKQTWLNVSELRHYAAHSISIWACRELEAEELSNNNILTPTVPKNCSLKSITRARTLKKDGADDVIGLSVRVQSSNQSLGIVRVEWQEPPQPNGLIVTYQIHYKRVDIPNHVATVECIPRLQYVKEKSYIIKNLNAGNYSIKVMATSLAGSGNYTPMQYFLIEDAGSSASTQLIIGSVFGLILVATALGFVGFFMRHKIFPPPLLPSATLIASVNPEYSTSMYVADEWEVPRNKIELIYELGQGSFGMVYEGLAKDIGRTGKPEVKCAVKTVNEHATDRERIDFLNEASVMKAFDTAHVVRLLGVVSKDQPTLVIMELMAKGDLKSYLRSHRPDAEKPRNAQPPSLQRILQMAMEIADGMAYLSANKFVHRDLAARNCMVSADLTVKVGDFGMTRDIYETDYYRKGTKGLLPVRWMSPESLKDGVFTSSSDVWSYGVVLWEMATLASQPYQGLSNDQVLRYVIDGGVMERPENCPDKLYQLMQCTWQHRPSARPSFLHLVAQLVADASPSFRSIAFYFTQQGQELLHQPQPSPAIAEDPGESTSPALAPWAVETESLNSDSLPPATPPASATSPPSSYRDLIRLVQFGERGRADPREMQALVGAGAPSLSHSAPAPPPAPKPSPPLLTAPNGFPPRPNNNGNPASLSTSRC